MVCQRLLNPGWLYFTLPKERDYTNCVKIGNVTNKKIPTNSKEIELQVSKLQFSNLINNFQEKSKKRTIRSPCLNMFESPLHVTKKKIKAD